ncbi:hypothetical protein SAMN05444955_12424 [Lihuaxuella thermophila]|uniref:Uncharacterized protein n=1 Tax=Lihuaxuella thermophila TaxID=1173111 RepID=A0A1H8JEK2_9BACL|nr:hypothetical protein SAMN05444955_12424 [Lihuaxuella thermophila]
MFESNMFDGSGVCIIGFEVILEERERDKVADLILNLVL